MDKLLFNNTGFTKNLRQAQKYPFLPNLRVLNSNLKSVFTHHLEFFRYA